VKEIRTPELKSKFDNGDSFVLLDVRESFEIEKAAIHPHMHIPMSLVPIRMNELDKIDPIFIICHTGARSWHATRFLENKGFNVCNILGGIHAWALEVDPNVPIY
jgi:rhodanese-related sulfurtransferase